LLIGKTLINWRRLKLTDLCKTKLSVALGENISGNLFEALIGAVYLDFHYDTCKKSFWKNFDAFRN
jgi:dsRNA-specific ribonuclease